MSQFIVASNILLIPAILPSLTSDFTLSDFESTALLMAFPAMALVCNLLIGPLLDQFGRSRFLSIGLMLVAACFIVSAKAGSPVLLIAVRALTGIAMPMIGATVFAIISDNFPKSERIRATGRVSAAGSLSNLLMIPAGVFLATMLDWRAVFFGLGCLAAVLVPLALWIMPWGNREPTPNGQFGIVESACNLVANHTLQHIMIAQFLQVLSVFTMVTLFPTWITTEFTGENVYVVFIVGGVGGLLGAMGVGNIVRDKQPMSMVARMLAATALLTGLVLMSATSLLFCAIAWGTVSFFRQMILLILIAHGNTVCPLEQRGSFNTIMAVVFHAASMIGGALAALAYAVDSSFTLITMISAAAAFAAAITAWLAAATA